MNSPHKLLPAGHHWDLTSKATFGHLCDALREVDGRWYIVHQERYTFHGDAVRGNEGAAPILQMYTPAKLFLQTSFKVRYFGQVAD